MLGGSLAHLASWLLVALGAAMFLGTGAALVQYRRTGAFPGQPHQQAESNRSATRGAVVKCVLGVVLLLWGIAGVLLLG